MNLTSLNNGSTTNLNELLPPLNNFATIGQTGSPSKPWQFGFQTPATDIAEQIIYLHHDIMVIILFVITTVLWFLIYGVYTFRDSNESANQPIRCNFEHNTLLEVIWTIVPAIALYIIAGPSMQLLYLMHQCSNPRLTLKAIGHQWYWSYEYQFHTVYKEFLKSGETSFDSSMIATEDLSDISLRNLEADHHLTFPYRKEIRLLVTAVDVIHSWAVPSFGVKVDAVPGRVNLTYVNVNFGGSFYGQCSELCGVGHPFMPIAVDAVTEKVFMNFFYENLQKPFLRWYYNNVSQ